MPLEGEGRIRGWKTGRVGGTRGEHIRSILGEKYGQERGHEGALCIYGRSIARSGPEAAITHAQSLYGVEYPNQWRGDDGERERDRERTFVSIHVNYRTRGGERQREEGAPFFFSFPQLPLYF